eukprot:EG_transcript_19065
MGLWPRRPQASTAQCLLGCSIAITSAAVAAVGGSLGALTGTEDYDAFLMLLRTAPGQGYVLLLGAASAATSFGLAAVMGTLLGEAGLLSLVLGFAFLLALMAAALTVITGCFAFWSGGGLCQTGLRQLWVFFAASDLPILCLLQQYFQCSGFSPPPHDPSNRGCCAPVTRPACYPPGLLPDWQIDTCPSCYDAADNAFDVPCVAAIRAAIRDHFFATGTCLVLLNAFALIFLALLLVVRQASGRHTASRKASAAATPWG